MYVHVDVGRASLDRSRPGSSSMHVGGLERLLGRLDRVGGQRGERVDRHPVELVERVLLAQRPQVDALPDVGQVGQVIGPAAVEVVQHDQPADLLELLLAELVDESPRSAPGAVRRVPRERSAVRSRVFAAFDDDRALLGDQLVVAPRVGVNVEQLALGDALRVVEQGGGLVAGDAAVVVGLQRAACSGSRWATTTSSSQLEKNTDEPGSPCRPARPRSWLSSRSVWWRPVPTTCRPPSSATSSWSASSDPPSRMSVPRPAIWVDTVTVPSAPASAMTCGFLGVVLGVQHHRGDARLDQAFVQFLRLGDVAGADEHGLPGFVHPRDVLDDRRRSWRRR